jgi:hypothetical protein
MKLFQQVVACFIVKVDIMVTHSKGNTDSLAVIVINQPIIVVHIAIDATTIPTAFIDAIIHY